jgi:hypothetical protein
MQLRPSRAVLGKLMKLKGLLLPEEFAVITGLPLKSGC